MFRLNNRGQSLVLFVVIIPIFLFLITIVYGMGTLVYEKDRLSNTIYMAINYYLDNNGIRESDVSNLIIDNEDNIRDIDIVTDDNFIDVMVIKDIKGFSWLYGFDFSNVEVHYVGKFIDGKKVIERV